MLYNRYLSGGWPKSDTINGPSSNPKAAESPFSDVSANESGRSTPPPCRHGTGKTGSRINFPVFDANTILLLALVYFLVADGTENITDTLLIVGVLLLLGF